MPPEPTEQLVDPIGRNEAAKPTISISGKWIGMHDKRAARGALPTTDHGCTRPGRRGFDMVGLPCIQHRVKRRLIIKIAITAIDWQPRRRNSDEDRAGTTPNYL